MRRAWLIACKDLKEGLGQRALMLRILLPSLILPVFYGVVTGEVIREAGERPQVAAAIGGQVALFAAIAALLGTFIGSVMSANAIALERMRRTMESLLATPATDLEIFGGKVMGAFLPAVAGGYAAGILYYATARLVAHVEPLAVPGVNFTAGFLVAVLPVVAAIEAIVGVIASSRCGTVTAATQLASLVTMPLVIAVGYVAYRAATWTPWRLGVFGIGLVACVLLLLPLGARLLGREEIVARLD